MSFAYLQLYTGDYLRDTRALTPLDHGVYLLLLMHCWDTKGPAPLDEQDCAGIANCRSATEIESLRKVLRKFFVQMDDGWYNGRMQAEIERAENISRARSDAGKAGYQARAKQLPSKRKALAKQVHLTPSPSPSLTPAPENEVLAPSPSGIAAAEVVITIPLNSKEEFPITKAMVDEWVTLYSDCDVLQTLKEIRGWNLANPTRRKTKSGVLNHVNRWLAKEHNNG